MTVVWRVQILIIAVDKFFCCSDKRFKFMCHHCCSSVPTIHYLFSKKLYFFTVSWYTSLFPLFAMVFCYSVSESLPFWAENPKSHCFCRSIASIGMMHKLYYSSSFQAARKVGVWESVAFPETLIRILRCLQMVVVLGWTNYFLRVIGV